MITRHGAGSAGLVFALQLVACGAVAHPAGALTERQRALDDATGLLWQPVGARAPKPPATSPTLATPPVPAQAPATDAPSAGSRQWPPVSPTASGPRPLASGGVAARPPLAAPSPGAPPVAMAPHRRIPDAIEGDSPPVPGTDALAGLAIEGRLRVLDGRQAPFRLLATRMGSGSARAQLVRRGAPPAAGGTAAWFEPGDSPAPGWRLVTVAGPEILLLTPDGNPLRLNLEAGAAPRLPDTARPGH